MSRRTSITVTDQFCGAGGSSTGATKAGAEVRLALNHWQLAIDTHNSNFPNASHDCTDISASDPRRYESTDILITSPECTNHSIAKGQRRVSNQMSLFNEAIDPAAERSRATMWDVPRFAEHHKYNVIIVENVVDARKWVTFDAWLMAMHQLGYDHRCVYLNSMHCHPTPQSRDRMYVVFWRKGNRAPNLSPAPRAHCQKCGHDVDARQQFINGASSGVYRKLGSSRGQYVYACPSCKAQVEPYYFAAANAIDWTLPSVRIGDRARPLRQNTLDRVQRGLDKYSRAEVPSIQPPFVIETTHTGVNRTSAITAPLPTQTARRSSSLVTPPPFIFGYYQRPSGQGAALSSITDPLPTQSTRPLHYIVQPFITSYYGSQTDAPITDPLGTVTTRDRHAVVVPPFIVNMQGKTGPPDIRQPMNTVLTNPHKVLIRPGEKVSVSDCGFRILEPRECGAAMGFADDYIVLGTKREQTKQYGNAVTPPAMAWLMERVMETFR